MTQIKLLLIIGTDREGNQTQNAVNLITKIADSRPEIELKIADPKTLKIPSETAPSSTEYSELTDWAEAFFIVSPEYNHSFPGTLKSLLDTEKAAYKYKPVTVAGVSDGDFGGARMIEALIPILKNFRMIISANDIYFRKVKDLFDAEENLIDLEYERRINESLDELVKLTNGTTLLRN